MFVSDYSWSVEAYDGSMKRVEVVDEPNSRSQAIEVAFEMFDSNSEIEEVWIYKKYHECDWGEKFTILRG